MEEQQPVENKLNIPWMLNNGFLLVSTPDGKVLDFPITEKAASEIGGVLDNWEFWDTVFRSLITSLKGTPSA